MAPLTQLPEDVLIDIFVRLSVPDVLALKKTCRTLYTLTSSDYLWHRLTLSISLPLQLPPLSPIFSLPASQLQPLCTAALRLDANWSNPEPDIRRFTPVLSGVSETSIDELRWLPGAQWLLTAQRNRPRGRQSTTFTFWAVPRQGEPYKAATFEAPGYYRQLSVGISENEGGEGERHATLALTVTAKGEELLQVYSIRLPPRQDVETVPFQSLPYAALGPPPDSGDKITILHHIPRPSTYTGLFYQVLLCGDIVAATIVNLTDSPGRTDHILLLNIRTATKRLIRLQFKELISRIHVTLYPTQFAIICALEDTLVVRSYAIPPELFSPPSRPRSVSPSSTSSSLSSSSSSSRHSSLTPPCRPQDDPQPTDLGPLLLDAIVSKLPHASDFLVSDNPSPSSFSPSPSLTFITFRFVEGTAARAYVASIALPSPTTPAPTEPLPRRFAVFPTPVHLPMGLSGGTQMVDLPRLGPSGRRGVWVQRNVETEEVRVVRIALPDARQWQPQGQGRASGRGLVVTLLSAYPNLPFRPTGVRALAFDEALGRLGVGLFNGEVYVLEF